MSFTLVIHLMKIVYFCLKVFLLTVTRQPDQKDIMPTSVTNRRMLSVCFDAAGFSFCVIRNGKFFYADRFEPVSTSRDQWLIETAHYFESNPYLNYPFDQVALCFVNKWQVVAPHCFYSPEKEEALLEFNTFLLENDPLEKNDIPRYGCHLIFSYSEAVETMLRKKYARMTLLHCGTSLLSSIRSRSDQKEMHLMFYRKQFDMAVVAGQKLILYNTFEYAVKEDVLYYVLFTAEQLKMNPNEFLAFVRGKISPQDEMYELLCRYVRHVEWEKHELMFEAPSKVSQENYPLLFSLQCASSQEG